MIFQWEVYLDKAVEAWDLIEGYLLDPHKRTYFWYSLSSIILAFWVYYKTPNFKGNFLQYLFPKNAWISASALTDFVLMILNAFVKILVLAPFIISGLQLAAYLNELLFVYFGPASINLTQTQTFWLYTIALTLANDFATYVVHYAMHKIPLLWEFHKVHHSASKLLPITQYRIHPVELIINNIKGFIVFGVVTGVFDYFCYFPTYKIMVIGVNIFSFIFLAFGANLRHSYVKLKYPAFLERIFISPFQHQIHHSTAPEHYDKNMGAKFAIWDWMFGTLTTSKNIEKLRFGIGKETKEYHSPKANLLLPFKKAGKLISNWFRKNPS